MSTISIIGKGNVGTAIGNLAGRAGWDVQSIGRDNTAPIAGEIIVFAVPFTSFDDIVAKYSAELAGRTVVDVSNPIDFTTFQPTTPASGSATAELAAALPQARVLKAFNTNMGANLTVSADHTPAVLIAGDDTAAKVSLAGLIAAGDLESFDVGPLPRAHELEALAYLQITLAATEKISWQGGFHLTK